MAVQLSPLSPEQVAELQEAFSFFDKNHTGIDDKMVQQRGLQVSYDFFTVGKFWYFRIKFEEILFVS